MMVYALKTLMPLGKVLFKTADLRILGMAVCSFLGQQCVPELSDLCHSDSYRMGNRS